MADTNDRIDTDDDEWNPPGDAALTASAHPRSETVKVTPAHLIRLAREGDTLVWEGRQQPLTVTDDRYYDMRYMDTGIWETGVEVEGPRGGEYLVANWWHYDDAGAGLDGGFGLYPQVRRITDRRFDSIGRFGGDKEELTLVDAPLARFPDALADVPDGAALLHDFTDDRTVRYGKVVGRSDVGHGSLTVQPGPYNDHDAPYAVRAGEVLVYREDGR